MNKFNLLLILGALTVLTSTSMAKPTRIFTPIELSAKDSYWAEPTWNGQQVVTGPHLKKKSALVLLVQLKALQAKGEYRGCMSQAAILAKKYKSISPWIQRVELDCVAMMMKSESWDPRRVIAILERIESQKGDLFVNAPYADSIRVKWREIKLNLLESLQKKQSSLAETVAQQLLQFDFLLNNSEKARLFRLSAEVAFFKQDMEGAKSFFERSLAQEENSDVRTRLNAVESSLGLISSQKEKKSVVETELPSEISNREKELDQRLTATLKSGDTISAMDDAMNLIAEFPAGARAKWATDKIYDSYIAFADKDEVKFQLVRERIFSIMKKADAGRLLKWAQNAYRAGNFEDSYVFATQAIEKSDPLSAPTKAMWFAARTAQFTGKTKKAKELFQQIADKHTGAEENAQALLQLGLISLRESAWATAVSFLERILAKPHESGLELVAHYWLWRALEKVDDKRAKEEAQFIVKRFPLSYYGLRARAELNGGQLDLPVQEASERKAAIPLAESERRSWDRLKLLYEAGWWEEAQLELRDIPEPRDPVARALLAKVMASVFDYPRAISLLNRVWEDDPTLVQENFLRSVYPRTFFSLVQDEASQRKIDPVLAMSLMRQESAFNVKAVSSSGAIGLMQMIPPTIKEVASLLRVKSLSLPNDMFDPKMNIKFCVYYLSRVLNEFDGNVPFALGAYNAGPTRLKKWLKVRQISPQNNSNPLYEIWIDELPWDETQFYIKAILRNVLLYRVLDKGRIALADPIWLGTLR